MGVRWLVPLGQDEVCGGASLAHDSPSVHLPPHHRTWRTAWWPLRPTAASRAGRSSSGTAAPSASACLRRASRSRPCSGARGPFCLDRTRHNASAAAAAAALLQPYRGRARTAPRAELQPRPDDAGAGGRWGGGGAQRSNTVLGHGRGGRGSASSRTPSLPVVPRQVFTTFAAQQEEELI